MKLRFHVVSKTLSALSAGVGVLVAIGWLFSVATARSLVAGGPPMPFAAAVGILVTAIALLTERPTARVVAGLGLALFGVAVIAQYIFGIHRGIDVVLQPATDHPGRMALTSATGFALLGAAMLLSWNARRSREAQACAVVVGAMGLVTVLGYAYSVQAFYLVHDVPMSLPMAVGFCLLSLAFLFDQAGLGWLPALAGNTYGAALARWLLPVAVLLPATLGYLRVVGERRGIFGPGLGVALFVVCVIVLFTLAVLVSGRAIDRWARAHAAATEAVRASEERFDLASRATSDAIWDWDFATDELWWNRGTETLFGHPIGGQRTLISWWVDRVHPEDRQQVLASIQRVISTGGTVWRAEYRFERADGGYADVLDRGYVARDARGVAVRMIGAIQDLTEAKRNEHALRASEERFRAIFEGAGVGMARVSFSDARWIDINDAFCRMVGYSAEELRAIPWPEITHPEDVASDLAPFRRMAAGELDSYTIQKRFVAKDGHVVWARLTLSLVRDRHGRPDYEIAVIENISDQVQAENELRASSVRERLRAEQLSSVLRSRDEVVAQLNALLANAPVGFAFFDREHRYVRTNDFLARRLNDRTVEAMLGRTVADILPNQATLLGGLIDRVFTTGDVLTDVEINAECGAPGNIRHWITAWFPVRTPDGTMLWVGAAVMEITRQKQVEAQLAGAREELAITNAELERKVRARTQELEETIRELEAFSYSLIHDLRAPLRAMDAYGHALEEDAAQVLPPDSREYIRRIKVAAQRMDQLITDSFNYSKVVRHELPLGPVNLGRLIRDMIATYPNLQQPAADVRVEFTDLQVVGNEAALTQVFSNLLGNAVKFVAPGVKPQVRVWHEDSGPRTIVWVEDNGIGIPPEGRERIFEMFQRMHRVDEYPGTGIGLAIVRKSLERIGGCVTVESEPGRGSRFGVELPRSLPLEQPAPAVEEHA